MIPYKWLCLFVQWCCIFEKNIAYFKMFVYNRTCSEYETSF